MPGAAFGVLARDMWTRHQLRQEMVGSSFRSAVLVRVDVSRTSSPGDSYGYVYEFHQRSRHLCCACLSV
eukprot:scaffold388231_cov24-Prasinocladus_malaysianus.AAC.1